LTHQAAADIISGMEIAAFLQFQIFPGFQVLHLAVILTAILSGLVLGKVLSFAFKKYSGWLDKREEKFHLFTAVVKALRRPAVVLLWTGMILLTGFILKDVAKQGFAIDPGVAAATDWLSQAFLNIAGLLLIYDFAEVMEQALISRSRRQDSRIDERIIPFLKKTVKIAAIIVIALQIFQIISGQSITTILAGLGIAGMAVALGAQDTIKNFFGFVMIVMDRPFKIGDQITFDGHEGTVESIGMRSVRMRRLDGHQVTIPNMQAVDRPIHNVTMRPNIQRIIKIGITYDTSPAKVRKALEILRDIFRNHEGMHPDFPPRVGFKDFETDSLMLRVIYWYHPADYWAYSSHAEKVNLEILERFGRAGIQFAFPTRTIHLAGGKVAGIKTKP